MAFHDKKRPVVTSLEKEGKWPRHEVEEVPEPYEASTPLGVDLESPCSLDNCS